MHHLKTVACVVSSMALAFGGPAAAQKTMGPVSKATAGPAPAGAAAAAAPVTCSLSEWVPDNQSTNHATDLPNPSGTATPKSVTIYFSPGGADTPTYPLNWSWNSGNSGNPVTVSISASKVTLNIFTGVPLHGVWDARSTNPAWTTYNNGYWRVAVCN